MKTLKKISIALTFALASQSASAELIFNLSSTGNAQADTGFQMAADRISEFITDDVTVNIDTEFKSLKAGVLGATQVSRGHVDYSVWRNALTNDSSSDEDLIMTENLPNGSTFDVLINGTSNNPYGAGSSTAYLDNNGGTNNERLSVTRANAKALGLTNPHDTSSDGSISFSSDFNFDFDPTDGISAGYIDFVGVAMHELLHALGFTSGVDILDAYTGNGVNADLYHDDIFAYATGMDFLRHSEDSIAAGADFDFTADTRIKGLSIDGGKTMLVDNAWATGYYNGDGHQASHFKDNQGLGLMDPTSEHAGNHTHESELDFMVMDVLGWDLDHSIHIDPIENVPAPASALLMLFALGGLYRKHS